jgi:rod shape-determining protein MreD
MRNTAFLAVGILLILAQANLYRLLGPLGLHGAAPSLILPLILFLGVYEHSMARGALLAFGLGYALDLFASAPIGLFTFVSVAIWWLSRVAGVRLTAQTVLTRMSLAFGFAIVESAVILILIAVFGSDTRRPLEMATVVLPRAAATALFSPLVFKIAQKLHLATTPAHGGAEAQAR